MSLLAELKRRNVFRVVGAYVVLSWLLLQVGDVIFDFLDVDDSAGRILIALLAIGFIPVVLFSWIYELTPEGVKKESEVDRSQSITGETGRKLDYATIAMIAIGIGFVLSDRFVFERPADQPLESSVELTEEGAEAQQSVETPAGGSEGDRATSWSVPGGRTAEREASEGAEASVAVLPFNDRSSEPDPNRFVEGIHDDLLTQLAKIGSLKVISRTSVMEYQGTTKNLRQIGEELGVETIMEGAVQRVGERVRINAQLIDASSDEHLWAETFDREMTAANVFDIQTEIAKAIANALQATLSPQETEQLERRSTDNLDALAAYQRARRLYDRYAFTLNQDTVETELAQALALDPDYVSAWALLARSSLARWWGGSEDPADLQAAWDAIEKGRAIDPTAPELSIAEGYYHYWGFLDYDRARSVLEPVLAVMPNNVDLHEVLAFVNRRDGEFEKALEHFRKAWELDPRSITVGFSLGETYWLLRDFRRAQELLDQIAEFAPTSPRTYQLRARLLVSRDGDPARAAQQYRVGAEDIPDFRVGYYFNLVFAKDYDAALENSDLGEAAFSDQWTLPPTMLRGLAHSFAGNPELAQPELTAALQLIDDMLNDAPGHFGHLKSRCRILGALGRKDATDQACAAALASIRDDAYDAPFAALEVAGGLAMAGLIDQAMDLVEAGVKGQAGPSRFDYALDPALRNLHDLPRWKELIEEPGS